MTQYTKCTLRLGKEAPVKRFHPWIFSGAIMNINGKAKEGDIIEVFSSKDEYLATGHFIGGSLSIKIFSFEQREINQEFWNEKIASAFSLREAIGLSIDPGTNAYRLVFSEGDGLPGLFIDFYNGTAVIQAHTLGMHNAKPFLVEALKNIYGNKLLAVYDKSSETLKNQVSGNAGISEDKYLFGKKEHTIIKEMGHNFTADWELGQKTGFFLDQRHNRMFAQFYARGKKVLNSFCYSGAFSVYSLKGGAELVHSVDSSRQAIAWTEENIALNEIDPLTHKAIVADVKKYLKETDEKYDMIILDPPAFAKHHNITHNALQAYIHINARAMEKLNPGGILFTFSCSQAISRDMFQSSVMTAALETNKNVRILHRLSQGPDHPVSLFHPEGEYLKGLILMVS